jgi:hypothetical protein
MRPIAKVAAIQKHPVNHRHSLAMMCAAACNVALLGLAGVSFIPHAKLEAPAPLMATTTPAMAPVAAKVAVKAPMVIQEAALADETQLKQVDSALKAAVRHATIKPAAHKKSPALAKIGEKELLARVMWHEARGQGRLGMLAAGWVTLNRVAEGYNGHKTIQTVVNEPFAYTWVKDPQATSFSASSPSAKAAMDLATRMLDHRLLSDEQELASKLGKANHFHAVTMAKYPSWAFSAKLQRVKLPHAEEIALGAVFYAPREANLDVASR